MLSLLAAGVILASSPPAACTVLVGRVVGMSYTELPSEPGLLNMDVLWRLTIEVRHVLQGPKVGSTIIYIQPAHGAPRRDRDIRFEVRRREDGVFGPCAS